MKRFDQTPFLDANGNLSLLGQVLGRLKYGMEWPEELAAQQIVLERLEKVLEKGFTVIRNYPLAGGSVLIPLLLIGPPGVFLLQVSGARGFFEAKGDEWNVVSGDISHPARINLIKRAQRFARAVEVLLERQGIKLPAPVEPLLVAADPGLHVQTLRPAIRIILSDAIERFALSLLQSPPLLSSTQIKEIVERLVNPPEPKPAPEAAAAERATQGGAPSPAAGRQAAPQARPAATPAGERPAVRSPAPAAAPSSSTSTAVPPSPRRRGLQRNQLLLLVFMGVIEFLLVVALLILFFVYR